MGMWTRSQGDYTVADADRFSGPPPDTFWAKWFGGVVFPLIGLAIGISMILMREATLYGQNQSNMDLHGTNALLYGWSTVSLAVFLHAHYFWGNVDRLMRFSFLGKVFSLTSFGACMLLLVYRLSHETFAF